MWTKLLIIGILSNIIISIAACTDTDGPEGRIETLYINESGADIRICSYRTFMYADGHLDSIPRKTEYRLNPLDSLKINGEGVQQGQDSVFVFFNEEKIWKNYRDSIHLKPNIYDGEEFQLVYPRPEDKNYIIQVFRFTPEHVEAAADLNE
ncbi:MAG TPA: hypothetical protein H9863_05715 [Candidatus Odoribacter faecigallinarum]|uniref:Uncharacterized protein n=1 Tax=Candidatus Odoribacter faecigallinarum TaxID=2838706 RepID=A0A9D2ABQ1_9BACT|nr:hypothetical protein [Candidatus Odoribacter faecigallinarum]